MVAVVGKICTCEGLWDIVVRSFVLTPSYMELVRSFVPPVAGRIFVLARVGDLY